MRAEGEASRRREKFHCQKPPLSYSANALSATSPVSLRSQGRKGYIGAITTRPYIEIMSDTQSNYKVIADNRRARFDYFLENNIEAGIMLTGTEVKSLRLGRANIAESYVSIENGNELALINADFPIYTQANRFNHEPRRIRKLLLHRREIDRLMVSVQREGLTIVPTKLFFNDKGLVKIEIALAKGKKNHDKRETEAKRDWQRDKGRLLREKG